MNAGGISEAGRIQAAENLKLKRKEIAENKAANRAYRHMSHPKIMSYPRAVTPDESNGSRLLIKCFEYVPPKTKFNSGYTIKKSQIAGEDEYGNKYKKGDVARDADGNVQLFKTNEKFENLGGRAGKKHHYYVELPIPQDVNDSNTVTWGDDNLNIFQLAGITAATNLLTGEEAGFEQAKIALIQASTKGMDLDPGLRRAVAAAISGQAIDNLGGRVNASSAIGRATGKILNSNLDLLFNGVNLRSFPMNMIFSPRSPEESQMVKYIIRAFKSSMAAKKGRDENRNAVSGQGGIFLRSPDVFQLRYLHNGKEHPFLNSFKHCALTGMSVNYTNAGTFASYSDGTPVSIQMSLTFKELNPIYHEDYDAFNMNDEFGVGF